jgi:ACT domain-containing protein
MQARTITKKKEFLDTFSSRDLTISDACKEVGISRWTYYSWVKKDKSFKSDVSEIWTLSELNKQTLAEEWARNKEWGVTCICQRVGISRWTFYNWMNNDYPFNRCLGRELDHERDIWAGKEWLKEHPVYKQLFGKPHIS